MIRNEFLLRTVCAILAVSLVVQLAVSQVGAPGSTELQGNLKEHQIDVGAVSVGQTVWGSVVLRNASHESWELNDPIKNCGCLGARLSAKSVPAGGTTTLHYTVEAPDIPDDFGALILVPTQAGAVVARLAVRGKATAEVWSQPSRLRLATRRQVASDRVRIFHPKVERIESVRVEPEHEEVSVTFVHLHTSDPPQTLATVKVDSAGSGQVDIVATTNGIEIMRVPLAWDKASTFIVQPDIFYFADEYLQTTTNSLTRSFLVLAENDDQLEPNDLTFELNQTGVTISPGSRMPHSRAIRFDMKINPITYRCDSRNRMVTINDIAHGSSEAVYCAPASRRVASAEQRKRPS